jgi:L-ascorbate metabolism protein UlaG (beta-lactamase superfamily)
MKNLTTHKITPVFFDRRPDTALTWLGMAGVLINARGTVLLIDPLLATVRVNERELCEGEYPLKLPLPIEAQDVPRLDAVLYTHADNDHFGRLTAQVFVERFQCRFIAPAPVALLLGELGADERRITRVNDGDVVQLENVEIVVTPAQHDWQEQDAWQRGDCCGYLVETPDGTIWHPGDTRLIDELLSVRGVDVLFFDVAAVDAHLGPAGSARLAESSGARVLVAYHYGTFDLPPGSFGNCDSADALGYLSNVSADYVQLDPGELLRLPL